jgi:hypothetical protein
LTYNFSPHLSYHLLNVSFSLIIGLFAYIILVSSGDKNYSKNIHDKIILYNNYFSAKLASLKGVTFNDKNNYWLSKAFQYFERKNPSVEFLSEFVKCYSSISAVSSSYIIPLVKCWIYILGMKEQSFFTKQDHEQHAIKLVTMTFKLQMTFKLSNDDILNLERIRLFAYTFYFVGIFLNNENQNNLNEFKEFLFHRSNGALKDLNDYYEYLKAFIPTYELPKIEPDILLGIISQKPITSSANNFDLPTSSGVGLTLDNPRIVYANINTRIKLYCRVDSSFKQCIKIHCDDNPPFIIWPQETHFISNNDIEIFADLNLCVPKNNSTGDFQAKITLFYIIEDNVFFKLAPVSNLMDISSTTLYLKMYK